MTPITSSILALSVTQMVSLVLVIILFLLGFKFLETSWSYKISKPHAWEEAVRAGKVSKKLMRIERFYRDKVRFYNFWFQIGRLNAENVKGAFAELGVYKGETARVIHGMDPSRKFYLLDTFEGFSPKDLDQEDEENESVKTVDFSDTSESGVIKFVDGNENVSVLKGFFPDTTAQLPDAKYALVHLDADLYQPTHTGLKYFYERLSPGGVIIVHDYNHNWDGVKKAVDEFKALIPESIIELSDWQGSIMIIKNRS